MRFVGVELPTELTSHYSSILSPSTIVSGLKVYARVHVRRVFNEEGDVVKEVNENIESPVIERDNIYVLDLTKIHLDYSIPIGYFLEVLLISLTVESGTKRYGMLVYPDEFRYSMPPNIPQKVSNLVTGYARVLRELGGMYEVVDLLSTVGLQDVSADLWEGLVRFYGGDYEGSIKFFRKVVEGLRNIVKEADAIEGSRKEHLYEYLSKAYSLISSFGEHAGTRGSLPEARLSRDIALSTSRYLAEYLKLKQGSQKQTPSTTQTP
ncbi:hypothetical protein [Vulcanisaeta sp. EB80]|uniref:hypothetical protein n=1 Tax=Vulcanisaeta sp. EB80 TaxID=1650660 RepID=UPI0011807186|nr:hypothetical protein [Vulcanisaeta sp. EB80]